MDLNGAKQQLKQNALTNVLNTVQTVSLPKEQEKDRLDDWEEQYEERMTKTPPKLELNSVQVPFIANWAAGKEVTLVIKAKVQEKETEETDKGKNRSFVKLLLTEITGL